MNPLACDMVLHTTSCKLESELEKKKGGNVQGLELGGQNGIQVVDLFLFFASPPFKRVWRVERVQSQRGTNCDPADAANLKLTCLHRGLQGRRQRQDGRQMGWKYGCMVKNR